MEGLLALASEDRILTLSTKDGDTRREIALQGEPADLQFSEMKMDQRYGGENTVNRLINLQKLKIKVNFNILMFLQISMVISKFTLFLYNISDPDNPIELTFQKRYGPIVTYKWYGDGYILIGFETGYLISISTHIKEVGQELFQIKNHKDSLNDISLNLVTNKIVTCGDNNLKIHDLQSLEETEKVISVSGEAGVSKVSWSDDGSMLAAATHSGNVLIYLAQVPKLTSVCGNKIAILTSLNEVAVYYYTLDKVCF